MKGGQAFTQDEVDDKIVTKQKLSGDSLILSLNLSVPSYMKCEAIRWIRKVQNKALERIERKLE
jgi:hypothetical protein